MAHSHYRRRALGLGYPGIAADREMLAAVGREAGGQAAS